MMRNVKRVRSSTRLKRAFVKVRNVVSRRFPELRRVKLFVGCPAADQSHKDGRGTRFDRPGHTRAYMHFGHIPPLFICCTSHYNELKQDELLGMLLHEFGHAIADLLNVKNTQDNADGLIWTYFRIPIYYRMPRRIQYVKSLDPQKIDTSLKSRLKN